MEDWKARNMRARRVVRSDREAYEAWRRLLLATIAASRSDIIDANELFEMWERCRRRDERLTHKGPPATVGNFTDGGILQELAYRGHDMEPTIGLGDKVYYDPKIRVTDGDGLYALKPAGVVIVRRLTAESGGLVQVEADSRNKTLYPAQIYAENEMHMLNIVGKVVGWVASGVTRPG